MISVGVAIILTLFRTRTYEKITEKTALKQKDVYYLPWASE
jgi:NADH:ubiquinone oxidoreductase subunit K